jgi:hypothetical protein
MLNEPFLTFNFDYFLMIAILGYVGLGFIVGGHKQIRLFINFVLPFIILYYLGDVILTRIYSPLLDTFLFELFSIIMAPVKYSMMMMFTYFLMYFLLFFLIFLLSRAAKKRWLNENMEAYLGKWNHYIGAFFALLNGYVFIYFIILPVFTLNIIGSEAVLTNTILQNPPPFSRIATTAEQAVPIKAITEQAADFQTLLSNDGIQSYYNDAIYEYQQLFIGGPNSYEASFMNSIYPYLSQNAQTAIEESYFTYFDTQLSSSNFTGISRVLIEQSRDGYLYNEIRTLEDGFYEEFAEAEILIEDYTQDVIDYNNAYQSYLYDSAYQSYLEEVENYESTITTYLDEKFNAIENGEPFTDTLSVTKPEFTQTKPENYEQIDPLVLPIEPEYTSEIEDAQLMLQLYQNKPDVRVELDSLGEIFVDHTGIITWYIDDLDGVLSSTATGGEIDPIIISFKENYQDILDHINNQELESKLSLARLSIQTYDVFSQWSTCALEHAETLTLEEIMLEENRCTDIDPNNVSTYDFSDDTLDVIGALLEGDTISFIIVQYKYDYETGIFTELFKDYPSVIAVLERSESFINDYDEYYKDIADSIDGSLPVAFKLGISILKYNFDVYSMLESTPIVTAYFNDAARICIQTQPSPINRDVDVCSLPEDPGILNQILSARALVSEIIFKAYLIVDDENEPIIYDSEYMRTFLENINISVEKNIITQEVVELLANELAFHVTDEQSNMTLLQEMYENDQITVEAMRLLIDDEYNLFSTEFEQRVRSLIR